ncbi:hypothetical protein D3C84_923450 [compost metagenome]
MVDEVAPAPDQLPRNKRWRANIGDAQEAVAFVTGINNAADERSDQRSVNRDAAFPDREDRQWVVLVLVPFEGNEIQSRDDNGRRNAEQQQVHEEVRRNAEPLAFLDRQQQTGKRRQAKYNTVPMNRNEAKIQSDWI